MKKRVRILLMIPLLCIMAFCIYRLAPKLRGYRESAVYYNDLKKQNAEKKEETQEDVGFTVDWEAWKDTDIVAWIVLDDQINYPVMQSSDNNLYLHHRPDKTYSVGGSIFLDSLCDPYFRGRNSIIYGHHMFDGSMFDHLMDFKDEVNYKDHKLYLYLPDGSRRTYQLFAVVNQRFTPDAYIVGFTGDKDFVDFQTYLKKRSLYEAGSAPFADNRLISLSTCDGQLHTKNRMMLVFQPVGSGDGDSESDYIDYIQEPASWYQAPEEFPDIW